MSQRPTLHQYLLRSQPWIVGDSDAGGDDAYAGVMGVVLGTVEEFRVASRETLSKMVFDGVQRRKKHFGAVVVGQGPENLTFDWDIMDRGSRGGFDGTMPYYSLGSNCSIRTRIARQV